MNKTCDESYERIGNVTYEYEYVMGYVTHTDEPYDRSRR